MKLKKNLFPLFLLVLSFMILSGCPNKFLPDVTNPYDGIQSNITESFAPGQSWTFMIYLDADNNLEESAIDDFNEMVSGLNGLNNSNINVVVLIDRIDGYDDNYLGETSDWSGAKIFEINQNYTYTKKTDGWFTDDGEINMGDPNTLKNFINYCKTKYPAQHYALVLWNHGGGARSKSDTLTISNISKDICEDDTDSDILYLDEVQQAVSQYFNSSSKLDFIGFDACLMGTIEVAYEFKDLALVMAGSMASEWGDGWDYDAIFKGMASGTNDDPKELGKLVVKTYRDSTVSQTDQTQAAIDLTKVSSIKSIIDNFAKEIYKANAKSNIETLRDNSIHFYDSDDDSISFPYFDLNDIAYQIIGNSGFFSESLVDSARDIIDSLSNIIIAAYAGSSFGNYYGLGSAVKRGLSIFFSRGNKTYNGYSHYAYQWWYTSLDTNTWWPGGHYYGKIDFADSDTDGIVETWRELFEAWYDPTNSYTPGSY
jgi:clostripain